MSIETRLRKLEGPAMGADGDTLDFAFIVGIKPVVAGGGSGDTTEPKHIRPSTDKPKNFFAYCLRPGCDARQHEALPGETVDQMAARLHIEHSKGA
jgi:hypothetical protein